jgi:hypothetical protein
MVATPQLDGIMQVKICIKHTSYGGPYGYQRRQIADAVAAHRPVGPRRCQDAAGRSRQISMGVHRPGRRSLLDEGGELSLDRDLSPVISRTMRTAQSRGDSAGGQGLAGKEAGSFSVFAPGWTNTISSVAISTTTIAP